MSGWTGILVALGLMAQPAPASHRTHAAPPQDYVVQEQAISDEKPVFATVDTANIVPARARVGGTLARMAVRQGDKVDAGQVIALVGDPKLALALRAADGQAEAARAQLARARADYDRAQRLLKADAISQSSFDAGKTAYEVALNTLTSQTALRDLAAQQLHEGQILAPASGRVLTIAATAGSVVQPGDSVATVAEQDFVLRLQIPERHARFLRAGDPIRADGADLGLPPGAHFGAISLVYPQINAGRVQADATLPGLSDYFVGARVRVWVSAGSRRAIVVPASLLFTRAGTDFARVRTPDGAMDVPVQRGDPHPTSAVPDGVEILSGLRKGDRLPRWNGSRS